MRKSSQTIDRGTATTRHIENVIHFHVATRLVLHKWTWWIISSLEDVITDEQTNTTQHTVNIFLNLDRIYFSHFCFCLKKKEITSDFEERWSVSSFSPLSLSLSLSQGKTCIHQQNSNSCSLTFLLRTIQIDTETTKYLTVSRFSFSSSFDRFLYSTRLF